ncbi:CoA pyrophosphatase [Algivirga pacifica]|uniref:CoA pyrophosphatase n=1 Tax=Algivirga pacifica TaxID=1162670 RepID=A0ABP9CWK0_9BACT
MKEIYQYIENLQHYLTHSHLPGIEAQQQMASTHHSRKYQPAVPEDAREAAVLILLHPTEGQSLKFPLIQRPVYNGVHSGQMALPGGKKDEEDVSLIHTALRECQEEIGITMTENNVLGTLSELYIPPSNMLVTPVIAFTDTSRLSYDTDQREVAEVVESKVDTLLQEENQKVVDIQISGNISFAAPAYHIKGKTVWGATAMILSEFVHIHQEIK